jgi:DNA-binding Xre family transcriptional regulator
VSLSYKKLWKQLIDRDMTRTDLRLATGISSSTFARLSHGDYVATSVIDRICQELKCDVGDMMEVVLDDKSHDTGMSDKRQRRRVK